MEVSSSLDGPSSVSIEATAVPDAAILLTGSSIALLSRRRPILGADRKWLAATLTWLSPAVADKVSVTQLPVLPQFQRRQ
jgi:hypothetical protein